MSLRDSIKAIVNDAVTSSLGDLSSTITFHSTAEASYNPTTGAVTAAVVNYTCTCVLTSLKQEDTMDLTIVRTGRKALVPSLQLSGVDVDSLNDEVTVDGVRYVIKDVKLDPAGALFSFILAAKQGMKLSAD